MLVDPLVLNEVATHMIEPRSFNVSMENFMKY